jgi:hypothetical protein
VYRLTEKKALMTEYMLKYNGTHAVSPGVHHFTPYILLIDVGYFEGWVGGASPAIKPRIQGVEVSRYTCTGVEAHECDYRLDRFRRFRREFPPRLSTTMTEDVVLSEKE